MSVIYRLDVLQLNFKWYLLLVPIIMLTLTFSGLVAKFYTIQDI